MGMENQRTAPPGSGVFFFWGVGVGVGGLEGGSTKQKMRPSFFPGLDTRSFSGVLKPSRRAGERRRS